MSSRLANLGIIGVDRWRTKKILLLGSRARITNLPVKEVSMLAHGSLPAYGYDPGDFRELINPTAARIHAEWRVDLKRRVDQVRKEMGLRGVW